MRRPLQGPWKQENLTWKDTETLAVLSIALTGSVIVPQTWVMESKSCVVCAKSSAGTCSTSWPRHVLWFPSLGKEKCARSFFAQTFWTPPGVRDIPAKFPGHPGFLSSKPKEDKVSRAGTKFSATTPSRGRPPPHRAVSGSKNLIFVLFFLAWVLRVLGVLGVPKLETPKNTTKKSVLHSCTPG